MADIMPDSNLKERLRGRFVGQNLHHVQTPSIVLDLAKLEVNCGRMLEATRRLDLLWRVHIKTHKTTELTRIQVGDKLNTPVSIMTSTVAEAEGILPLLKEYQAKGRNVNVLLAFPLFPSAAVRLSRLSSELGPGTVAVMIDHPDQLSSASAIARAPDSHPPLVFLKIDAGYGRAGVVPSSTACAELIDAVLAAELAGSCVFHGVYCHAGHSYGLRKDWEAMHYLAAEFAGLHGVASYIRDRSPGHPLVLSVGATPTATTIQHPTFSGAASSGADAPTREVETLFAELKVAGFQLEVHAGVYPTLDLQQLATHARDSSLMTADNIAVTVLAEVASVYPSRGPNNTPEALIAAGTLALGREPVADKGATPGSDYSGWGILAPWGKLSHTSQPVVATPDLSDFPRTHAGWQVGRISQEHGILVWKGSSGKKEKEDEEEEYVPMLRVGDKVRVWPNHSCIAGACFEYYLVVDSRNEGREDEVVDVWPRFRGW